MNHQKNRFTCQQQMVFNFNLTSSCPRGSDLEYVCKEDTAVILSFMDAFAKQEQRNRAQDFKKIAHLASHLAG